MPKKLTKAQKEMAARVASIQMFVSTYDKQPEYRNYHMVTFVNDMLYGLGLSLDAKRYQYAIGYREFLGVLKEFISNELRARKKDVEAGTDVARRDL